MSFVIRGGSVLDGTGRDGFVADVAIQGDRIAKIGTGLTGAREIDARGKCVAPGFIDAHSHSDLMLFAEPGLDPKVRQGITTDILGQDGISVAPVKPEHREDVKRRLAGLLANPKHEWTWTTMAEYLAAVRARRCAINTAMLVPHGAVRQWVMGMAARPATASETDEMKRVLAQALDEGALGMSTGLIYPPCAYAETVELIELARVAAARSKPIVAHIRNEGDFAIEAVEEMIRVARRSGVHAHISHFKICGRENWARRDEMLGLVDRAIADGVQVTADIYPYDAGSTMLGAILPPWVHEGGAETAVTRLREPATRARIAAEIRDAKPAAWDNFWKYAGPDGIRISDIPSGRHGELVGKTLAQAAGARDPLELALDLLVEESLGVAMISFTMQEKDVEEIVRRPYAMICTDGLMGGRPHPRVYGAFARVLAWARDRKLFTLPEAVRKMTSLPARTFGLKDRGTVAEGAAADLVVFDPARVRDRATFDDPRQFPEGIDAVIVAGEIVVERGARREAYPGRVLTFGCGIPA